MSLSDLLVSVNWFPGNGDPTLMGDVTVLAYLVTAVSCTIAAWKCKNIPENASKHRWFWTAVSLLFFFFAFNKHTNLQSGFTSFFRLMAFDAQWYDVRQSVQIPFVVGVLVVTAVILIFALWLLRSLWKIYWLTIIGVAYQLAFVIVRATSLHAMDGLINYTIAGIRMNWVLEFAGILLVLGTAVNFIIHVKSDELKVLSAE